jgi:flagellar biosynthesis protein FlhF
VLKSPDQCRKYLGEVMEARLRLSGVRLQNPPAKLICLVGTSGVGKTTLAGRLAMIYGAQASKKVTWICADVIRTGAIVEARTYTDALNLPLAVVYTPAELKQAVAEAAGSDLIIVDLPGYNPLDEDQVAELGGLLTEIPDRCLLLVASASQKETDLLQAAASFGVFGLDGLVVTKLDETATFGSIFNVAMKTGLPLAYFSSGKGAYGSLEAASTDRLVRALLGKGRMQ